MTEVSVKLAMRALVEMMTDKELDMFLVQEASVAMRAKLDKKRDEGYHDWATDVVNNDELLEMLKEHVEKGDMVDVMNLAAMMHARTIFYGDKA